MKLILKAKRMPVGTVSKGRKKVAEGKWRPIKKQKELKINNLTKQEIKKLKKDKTLRDNFVKQNQAYIVDTMKDVRQNLFDRSDALQDGNIGLLEALKRFDTKKNPKGFQQYARKYIAGYMAMGALKEYDKSLNIKVEDKEFGETISDPKSERGYETAEMQRGIQLARQKIKNKEAKKILDLIYQGYNKTTIAKMLDTTQQNVNNLVARHIKPALKDLKESFLGKSVIWNRMVKLINEFLGGM